MDDKITMQSVGGRCVRVNAGDGSAAIHVMAKA